MEVLGYCTKLQHLDLTGSNGIGDEVVRQIPTEVQKGDTITKLGYPYLTILKLGQTNIPDISLIQMTKNAPNLEHLEIQKCERITEFGIKSVLEGNPNLEFLDCNRIPVVNYAF